MKINEKRNIKKRIFLVNHKIIVMSRQQQLLATDIGTYEKCAFKRYEFNPDLNIIIV